MRLAARLMLCVWALCIVIPPAWPTSLQEDARTALGAGPRRIEIEPSSLSRLAQWLRYAGADYSADFARAALQQMLAAYGAEIDSVREQGSGGRTDRADSWSTAAALYLRQLAEAMRRLDSGAPVSVSLTPLQSVQVMIGNQPVIVQGPRLASPDAFEQRIVQDFCTAHTCPEPPRSPRKIARFASPSQGIWSFSDSKGHSFETRSGLRFVFRDLSDRRRKQRLCLRLSEELALLAEGLRSTRTRGVIIDWEQLQVVSLGDGYLNRVTLNARGDYFELKAPNLGHLPTLWREATPWLQAQVEQEESEHFVSDADTLLLPLLE